MKKDEIMQNLSPCVHVCGEYELPPGFRREPYFINDHEFIYVDKGNANYRVGPVTHALKPGDVLLVPPYVANQSWNTHAVPLRFMAVHFDFFNTPRDRFTSVRQSGRPAKPHPTADIPAELGLPRIVHCADEANVKMLFGRLIGETSLRPQGFRLTTKACLLELIALVMQRTVHRAVIPQRITSALAYIETNFTRPIRLADIARIARFNEVYFERLFKLHVGATPMQYLTELRLRKAKSMLAKGAGTIREIARASGFSDPYHFSRTFHRIEGVTPSQYRKAADHNEGIEIISGYHRKSRLCRLYQGYSGS